MDFKQGEKMVALRDNVFNCILLSFSGRANERKSLPNMLFSLSLHVEFFLLVNTTAKCSAL